MSTITTPAIVLTHDEQVLIKDTLLRVLARIRPFKLRERSARGESLTALEWEALNTLCDVQRMLTDVNAWPV